MPRYDLPGVCLWKWGMGSRRRMRHRFGCKVLLEGVHNDDYDSLDHRVCKFLGDRYAEYNDLSSNNPNPGFSRAISSLGLSYTEGIDAALSTDSDVAYFIKGFEYELKRKVLRLSNSCPAFGQLRSYRCRFCFWEYRLFSYV